MIKGAQSVYRTLNILKLILQKSEEKISLKDVSERLEIPAPTVHRLLSVLKETNFVSFDAVEKKYYISEECLIAANFDRDQLVRSKYLEFSRQLAEKFGYTTSLYTRKGDDCVCIERVEGTNAIQVFSSRVGEYRPLGLGSCTLGIIAFLEDEELDAIIERNQPQLQDRFVGSFDDLRAFIKISRSLGYGYAHDMSVKGAVGISFPIRMNGEIIGALAVDAVKGSEWEAKQDPIVGYIQSNMH